MTRTYTLNPEEDLFGRASRLKIMVSSRINETLRPERARVIEALDAIPMVESWAWERDAAAGPYYAEEECLGQAATSDGLILVIADELSPITLKEYQKAKDAGAAVFILVKDGIERPQDVEDFIARARVDAITKGFSSATDLASSVSQAVQQYLVRACRTQQHLTRRARLDLLAENAWDLDAKAYDLLHGEKLSGSYHLWRQMRSLGDQLDDGDIVAAADHGLALVSHQRGDLGEARALYTRSLLAKAEANDRRGVLGLIINLAVLDDAEGNREKAEASLRQIETALTRCGVPDLLSAYYGNLGTLSAYRRDFRHAERLLRRAMKYARLAETSEYEVIALRNLGALRLHEQRPRAALYWFERALSLATGAHILPQIQVLQRHVAATAQALGAIDRSIQHLEALKRIAEEVGDERELALTSYELGSFATAQGDFQRASELLEAAFDSFERLNDTDKQLAVLRSLVVLEKSRSRLPEAQRRVDQLLALMPRTAYAERGHTLKSAAMMWLANGGDGRKSKVLFERSLKALAHSSPPEELAWETNLAAAMLSQNGAPEHSLVLFVRARQIYSELGNEHMVFNVWNDYGNALVRLSRLGEGELVTAECLKMADRLGDPAALYAACSNAGEIARRQGKIHKALALLRRAVSLAQERNQPEDRLAAMSVLGLALLNARQWDEAEETYSEFRTLAVAVKDRERESEAIRGVAYSTFNRGSYASAIAPLREAIRLAQSQRDVRSLTDATGVLVELHAALGHPRLTLRNLQRLVDIVEREGGNNDAASVSAVRAGREWLRRRNRDQAVEAFAASVLLAIVGEWHDDESPNKLLVALLRVAAVSNLAMTDCRDLYEKLLLQLGAYGLAPDIVRPYLDFAERVLDEAPQVVAEMRKLAADFSPAS